MENADRIHKYNMCIHIYDPETAQNIYTTRPAYIYLENIYTPEVKYIFIFQYIYTSEVDIYTLSLIHI